MNTRISSSNMIQTCYLKEANAASSQRVLFFFLTEDKYDRGEGHVLKNIYLLLVPSAS